MSVEEHKGQAPVKVRFSVLTISDRCSRGVAEDASGAYIVGMLSEVNTFVEHRTVPDEECEIYGAVRELAAISDCVVTTGGTGVARRDVTIAAVKPMVDKHLPGFGELFRRLSYDEIGTASMMSGAMAGIIGQSVIFCLPGSLPAVKLGTSIIVAEAGHIIKHLRD